MNRFLLAGLLASAFCFSLIGQARADIADIRGEDNSLELDVGGSLLKYGEDTANSTFDTEESWMPSVGFGGSLLTNSKNYPILSNLYLSLNGSAVFGQTDYRGGLQNPITHVITPYNTTDNAEVYTLNGQIGHAFALSDSVMLTPLADFGYRYWKRTLTGSGGYEEDYKHYELLGGFLVQYSPIKKLVLSLTGEGGSTINPNMTTSFGDHYTLGQSPVWEVGGKVGYMMTQYFEGTAGVNFKGFGYGASGQHVSDTTWEPASYTHELTTQVGVAYHFAP